MVAFEIVAFGAQRKCYMSDTFRTRKLAGELLPGSAFMIISIQCDVAFQQQLHELQHVKRSTRKTLETFFFHAR